MDWLGWALAVVLAARCGVWRARAARANGSVRALTKLLRARAVPRGESGPPPLPPPDPPLELPRGVIMRRLTGVWKLPRFQLPDEE